MAWHPKFLSLRGVTKVVYVFTICTTYSEFFKKPPSHLMRCESHEPVSFICADAPKARYSQYQDQLRRVHEDASGCKLLCQRIEAEQVEGMSWGKRMLESVA